MTMLFRILAVASALGGREPMTIRWDFEDGALLRVPPGWKVAQTGQGAGSVWKVLEDKSAPKGDKVLAQIAESPSAVFNLCVAEEVKIKDKDVKVALTDLEVSVAFKAVAGKADQGGGIVWRYQDANNYYIARMNPLENNYRLYKVVNGKRIQLATKEDLKIAAGDWRRLKIRHVGKEIACFLDGKKLLEAKDDAFLKAGKVGLWTKADAQTYFDDFVVEELVKQ